MKKSLRTAMIIGFLLAVGTAFAGAENRNYTDPVTGMEFVWVQGGCFQMGDTFDSGLYYNENEKPVHKVCVDGFWIGKTEVTQGQWRKIMSSNPSYFKKGDNYPIESVSWVDCQAFIKKMNSQSGKKFRLPYEAEWEYAARSGGKSENYAGGSDIGQVAWYSENSGNEPQPVGGKSPNGLELYDMSGNVFEWCEDWYGKNYYSNSPQDNPHGPSEGTHRILRGGSWMDVPSDVRNSFRFRGQPGGRDNYLGFRLVLPHFTANNTMEVKKEIVENVIDIPKNLTIGTISNLVTNIHDVKHKVQCWKIEPSYAKPGRWELSIQHVVMGSRGAFYLTAWTDTNNDGLPDRELDRSELMVAKQHGDWSSWGFTAKSNSIFVGNCWTQRNELVFYQKGNPAPDGYNGLGNVNYYSRQFGTKPNRKATPRYTNIRLRYIGQ